MTIEEFIEKCQKRPIPKNPMDKIKLLARELADGAINNLWTANFTLYETSFPDHIFACIKEAIETGLTKFMAAGSYQRDAEIEDLYSNQQIRDLEDIIANGVQNPRHSRVLQIFIIKFYGEPLKGLSERIKLTIYFCVRWWKQLPNINLLENNGFIKITEDNSRGRKRYILHKSSFDLLEEIELAQVFISYKRSESSAFALLIRNTLKQHGLEPFVDMQLQAGADWQAELEANIKNSDYFIVLLGNDTLHSDVAIREIRWAIEGKVTLIPIWHNGFRFESEDWSNLPEEVNQTLASTHTIRVLEENPLTYDTALRELLNRFGISI